MIESTKKIKRRELRQAFQQVAIVLSIAVSSSFSQVTYSDGWTERKGSGPWGDLLHTSTTANATATIKDTGTEVFVIHRTGTQNGIFQVVVDGDPSTAKEIDTYSPNELWNRKTVIASNLTNGPHTIVVTVTGKKNASASAASIQIVDKWTLGRGMWSPEKAWAWYKSKPWIVGWNYTPTTCVNATEWWQDEKKANDSIIHRDLKIGEQLGYNSIVVYMQYLVWEKDSAYYKNRFSRFLSIAESHHMTVSPVFFDDVNFVCGSGDSCGNSKLGDQGEPNPNLLMSQWAASPGPTYVLDAANRPKFKRYVQDFIRSFGQDKRILMWDLYNEPSNSGMGSRTYPLVELAFVWAREIGCSQPLTVSEWNSQNNAWPYNLSDICSFHGYMNNSGLSGAISKFRATQRPIICTEWLARQAGTNIPVDLQVFKRQGVGAIQWSLINGRMHCERSWTSFGSSNNPWFHDVLYNDGKPYKADEVFALYKNLARKTINWVPGTTDGSIVVKRGCTDPRYSQYDSMATEDDGSCKTLLPANIPGCMDKNSKNFCPFATQSDPAMCNAVDVIGPPQAEMPKQSAQTMFSFIGPNRIHIFEHSIMRVEVYNTIGQMVWNSNVEGPCVIDIKKTLKSGVYCTRFSTKKGNVAVTPMFRVQ
jgi:hypothetical protein